MEFTIIFIVAVSINNIVLSQFLGICPSLGISKKVSAATGMGIVVTFALLLATMVTWLVQTYILVPIGLESPQTITLIPVTAALVQMIEMTIKRISPVLYQALDVFLSLITANCYVLGVAILVTQKEFTYAEPLVYTISTGIGFLLAMIIFAGIREQLAKTSSTPRAMKGTPIALITADILAMALIGFSGLAAI